jgi:hypothetical protein
MDFMIGGSYIDFSLPDTINRNKGKLRDLAKSHISVAISMFSYIFEESDINVTN